MSNYLLYGIIVILIVAVIVLAVLLGTDDNSSKESKNIKALFQECSTNMDCPLSYLCELRDRPSKGICVIPPGGACHAVNEIKGVCYSGYYCDKQDGVCLKE